MPVLRVYSSTNIPATLVNYNMMIRLLLVVACLHWHFTYAQNNNDNCENAIDVTSQIFNYTELEESCNSIIGTLHPAFGSINDSIVNITVDAPVYSSQGCIGYKPQTTDHYPDLWYRSTYNGSPVVIAQRFFLNAGDTIQIAIYYGQCGSLFQSQCFTLTYADSIYWQGAWIIYYPHNVEDDIFIQLKVPPQYQEQIDLCFSNDIFIPGVGHQYPFAYDRPAGTLGTTLLNSVSPDIPVTLFPNPVNNSLYLKTVDEIIAVSISDTHGRLWFNAKSDNNIDNISVDGLPPGLYVVTIKTKTGTGRSKLVKQGD